MPGRIFFSAGNSFSALEEEDGLQRTVKTAPFPPCLPSKPSELKVALHVDKLGMAAVAVSGIAGSLVRTLRFVQVVRALGFPNI
ncbi:hypothetical protein Nepgr_008743 [Nepenthes gracilis]|uniref:Uncharacterized protein n=1 Tax=Nepenthes gracilis TaxID=150966 RepID=A0AAD3S980_NEPGR|nr:hypothetical protein Nepgr_008743 [Nepenthes gracilis]